MDANLTTLLGLCVTSLTSIIIAAINVWKSVKIERAQEALSKGVAEVQTTASATHAVANGRLDAALQAVESLKEQVRQLKGGAP